MKEYISLAKEYATTLAHLNRRDKIISYLRLTCVLAFFLCFYSFVTSPGPFKAGGLILTAIAFIILIKAHLKTTGAIGVTEALLNINRDEISFLKHESIPFADGAEFKDVNHPYSYDLDFFGPHSLFHHLNRSTTYIGKNKFAHLLLSLLPGKEIVLNQEAVKELSAKMNWRQQFAAYGKITNDSKSIYEKLMQWSAAKNEALPASVLGIAWLSPVLTGIFLFWYIFSKDPLFISLVGMMMLFNLAVLASQYKKIRKEMTGAGKVHTLIENYSFLMEKMEKEEFKSERMRFLQSQLAHKNSMASLEIKKLSSFFGKMDRVNDMFVSSILNGLFLYHLHVLNGLLKWKKEFSSLIPGWMDVIGETEALCCLANFSYNNPAFTFPVLNTMFHIRMEECGHPLIRQEKRICNTADFNTQPFIILTGSNMSGKSTWLRTLGINMVLAGVGSPVCAVNAVVCPMKVLTSIRLDDSLSENESYFLAEVKRLKNILNELDGGSCFIILDEILKGTNSDDKREGTLSILQKLVEKKAIGALATHDLEICTITNHHPGYMTNKCFEAEIINNNLIFDYKLREGICKNKSATFLMEKMGII